jgi:hypothetical protein
MPLLRNRIQTHSTGQRIERFLPLLIFEEQNFTPSPGRRGPCLFTRPRPEFSEGHPLCGTTSRRSQQHGGIRNKSVSASSTPAFAYISALQVQKNNSPFSVDPTWLMASPTSPYHQTIPKTPCLASNTNESRKTTARHSQLRYRPNPLERLNRLEQNLNPAFIDTLLNSVSGPQ